MNDPMLAIRKLKELLKQAAGAESDLAKASTYSAARWLIEDLQAESDKDSLRLSMEIEEVRWAFGALLGFDIDNGRGVQSFFTQGLGGLQKLEQRFRKVE